VFIRRRRAVSRTSIQSPAGLFATTSMTAGRSATEKRSLTSISTRQAEMVFCSSALSRVIACWRATLFVEKVFCGADLPRPGCERQQRFAT
jgi:hypothetical protein